MKSKDHVPFLESLNKSQIRWSILQKEGYGIFYTCRELDPLLCDRQFVLRTDHRNQLDCLSRWNCGSSSTTLRSFWCSVTNRSDRGSHFVNSLIREFLLLIGTDYRLTHACSKEVNALGRGRIKRLIDIFGWSTLMLILCTVGVSLSLWCSVLWMLLMQIAPSYHPPVTFLVMLSILIEEF